MARKEEIYKAARDYLFNFFIPSGVRIEEWNTCFEAGAKWADEHPKNLWRDAKNDPPKDMKPVVGYDDGIIGVYEYSPEEKIWSIGMLISDAPEYWVPIPKLKGGEI